MRTIQEKIKNKDGLRGKMSNDYMLGYYDAIAACREALRTSEALRGVKGAFDLLAFQTRATQKVDKRARKALREKDKL